MIISFAPVSFKKFSSFCLTVSGLPTIVVRGSSDCCTAAFSIGVHTLSMFVGAFSCEGVPLCKLKNCCFCDDASHSAFSSVSAAMILTPTIAYGSCKTSDSLKRSEEHTSELQSRGQLVCSLLLEKKKRKTLERIYLFSCFSITVFIVPNI